MFNRDDRKYNRYIKTQTHTQDQICTKKYITDDNLKK